jgi:Flp pilus assembly protein CpaB
MRVGRTLSIILGLLLSSAAVVGVIFMGSVVNPPRQRVLVARVEIPAGTTLKPEMVGVVEMEVMDDVLAAFVPEDEQLAYLGYPVVETIYPFEPIRRSALSVDGSPANDYRMSLGITDPDLVAMPIPVDQTRAPNTIQIGDRVDVIFGASGERFGNPLEPQPTAAPQVLLPGEVGADGLPGLGADPAPTASATTLYGPFAKVVVTGARVLDVIRETTQQQVTDEQGRVVTVDVPGNLVALLVLVPRQSQELLQFAIDNGSVRVSLLSAQVQQGADTREPSLGVVYNDLVALIELDRARAVDQGLPSQVLGPGADLYQQPEDGIANGAGQGVETVTQPPRPSPTPRP